MGDPQDISFRELRELVTRAGDMGRGDAHFVETITEKIKLGTPSPPENAKIHELWLKYCKGDSK